jgi:flagellar hook-associated protein 3 FlgL
MRITTAYAFESSLNTLQRRQSQLSETQQQLTSGKRVLKASDDPAAAATAERARATLARSEAQGRALDASRNAMQLTESALGDAAELMQQAREVMVGAGNGTYSDSDRLAMAEHLKGLRNDLLAVANRSDGAGRYLFGGQGSDSPPLRDTPTGVVFDGLAGQLNAAAGEATPLAVDGQSAWLQATDPATGATNLSVFGALDQAVADLETPGRTSAQVATTVATGLGQLDAAASNLSRWRTRAGESLNRIDGIESRLSQTKLDAERQRSTAEDLDMVAGISEFQSRQSGYDAALKTYSMVQRMSLFDYLK